MKAIEGVGMVGLPGSCEFRAWKIVLFERITSWLAIAYPSCPLHTDKLTDRISLAIIALAVNWSLKWYF